MSINVEAEKNKKKKTGVDWEYYKNNTHAAPTTTDNEGNPLSEYEISQNSNNSAYQDTINTLETNYNNASNQIEENYIKAIKDAEIARAVASKYLPEQMARMGWDTNLGATTSGVNQIMANYGQLVDAANERKSNSLDELYNNVNTAALDALNQRNLANDELYAQQRVDKRAADLNNLQAYINGSNNMSAEDAQKYYDSLDEYTKSTIDKDTFELRKLGVDPSKGISLDSASVSSFGTYKGTKTGGIQDDYVNGILDAFSKYEPKSDLNGLVVDFNYGYSNGGASKHVFYNGKFYPTNLEADIYYRDYKGQTDADIGYREATQENGFGWKFSGGKLVFNKYGGVQ